MRAFLAKTFPEPGEYLAAAGFALWWLVLFIAGWLLK